MVPLRVVALCSNVAFLIYGGMLYLVPIFMLHAALIPINVRRLIYAWRDQHIQLNNSTPRAPCALSLPLALSGRRFLLHAR